MISVCVGSVRSKTLPHLVESVIRQDFADWELIVAAQGNDPELLAEVERAERRDTRIRSLRLSVFGLSRARNAAVEAAHGDIVAFIDDDCEAARDWLSTIHACFNARPDVDIVGGNLVPSPAKGLARISTCPATFTREYVYVPAACGYSSPPGVYWGGANLAVRRDVFVRVGMFDPYLGPGSDFPAAEDVDFGLRAEAMNVAMWTTPKLVVYHTFGRRFGLKSILRHHRAYALGSGALGAKLSLLNHRLMNRWGTAPAWHQRIRNLLRGPIRELLDIYKSRYIAEGRRQYLVKFRVGPANVSELRHA